MTISRILKEWLFGVELVDLEKFKRAVASMQMDEDGDNMISVGELYRVLKLLIKACR